MRSELPVANHFRRPERRVFGKDITNTYVDAQKNKPVNNQKNSQETQENINQKHVLVQNKEKSCQKITKKTDPINQYNKDIICHILSIQNKYQQQTNSKVTKNMRQMLIDWMIDVHVSFQLKEQTLHLALSYLNEFQAKSSVQKQDYQLVGIACLWIASKFEQIYPPRMKQYINVTADTYTMGQLRRMQEKILQKLSFSLNHTTLLLLLQASIDKPSTPSPVSQLQKKSISFAKYIFQLILIEGKLPYEYLPSMLVSTVLLVCNSTKKLQQMKSYTKDQIYQCYKEIVQMLREGKSYGSDAIKRKYQQDKHHKVGKLKIQLKNEEK